ncbi:MAG: GNAT family N-acetyltransferase [Pseudomonadota bacterium]
MSYHYRLLTRSDQAAFRALRLLGLQLYPENFLSSYEDEIGVSAEEDRTRLDQGRMRGLWDAKGRMVGMSGFMPETPQRAAHRAYIGGFMVHPDHHGTGAAQVLMRNLIAEAKDIGVWQLELHVNETNLRARRFYEKHGFRAVGTLPNAILTSSGPETDLFMVSDLRDAHSAV